MLAPGPAQGAAVGMSATLDQSHLTTADNFGGALFDDVAHRFCVHVYCAELRHPGTLDTARAVLEREKPAHTEYHLCVIEPRMRVGAQARIGIDAIVAQGRRRCSWERRSDYRRSPQSRCSAKPRRSPEMHSTMNGFSGPLSAPERNHFFYGLLMDVARFEKDARYSNAKRSLINRLIVGRGVVCGLNVEANGDNIVVSPGIAIDGWGREIILPEARSLNPHTVTDDEGIPTGTNAADGAVVSICLAYAETETDPVPVLVADCDTPGNCAPSTVLESAAIIVRETQDPAPAPPECGLGQDFPLPPNPTLHSILADRLTTGCPDAPADPCVALGRVTLGTPNQIDAITGRQLIYSNALLYS